MSTPVQLPPSPAPPKPGLLQRIQRIFEGWFGSKPELEGQGTTQTARQTESPTQFEYQLVQLEYDRRAILQDVRRLMDDDPRIAQSNQDIGRDSVGGGLKVKVMGAEGTPDQVTQRAQDIIDSFFRDTDLNGHLPASFSGLLEDGDLFLSPIVRSDQVVRIQVLPAATIERLDNDLGLFADAQKAFRQVDVITLEELTGFPLWQVNHVRFDWRPNRGAKYGRSMYLQVRGYGRYLGMTENDMVVRRRTRAPLRFFHRVGDTSSPGTDIEIQAYKRQNSLDKPVNQRVTTDFFGNGLTDVKELPGDAKLGEIEDVEHLQNVYWIRLGRPKGLMGFGEDINRDVLEQQQAEYQEFLTGLRNLMWNGDGGVYSGLKALCDFVLALSGINPQQVTYQPSWPRKLTKEQLEYIQRMAELRVQNFISHQTALGLVGALLGIESAEAELLLLEEERAARMKLQAAADREFAADQTGAAGTGGGDDEGDEDDDRGEGVKVRKADSGGGPRKALAQ